MENFYSRTELLLGEAAVERLKRSRVAVFGVGGVGGYAVEALARCGVGAIDLIDSDSVTESNINRQIIATRSSVGKPKVQAALERIGDINPECKVTIYEMFFSSETAGKLNFSDYDYIIDAIDSLKSKRELILKAKREGVPIISSMGAGNKLEPTAFEVSDIYKTSVCPLARVMRTELRKRGIKKLKVVYSKEEARSPIPIENSNEAERPVSGRPSPASISFVPSVMGLIIAGEVIKDITK